jgi:catechol 2,3-dioxygenase-like lactoylglutathione lyase family enzyme
VHAGAAELKAAGVKFIYQPALARGKVVTSFFEDPDGNALELIDGVPTCDA